jgi:hypothetical protein
MAELIQFPQRGETKTLHFDERHAFGEIGGLMLSLVQGKTGRSRSSCLEASTGSSPSRPLNQPK